AVAQSARGFRPSPTLLLPPARQIPRRVVIDLYFLVKVQGPKTRKFPHKNRRNSYLHCTRIYSKVKWLIISYLRAPTHPAHRPIQATRAAFRQRSSRIPDRPIDAEFRTASPQNQRHRPASAANN